MGKVRRLSAAFLLTVTGLAQASVLPWVHLIQEETLRFSWPTCNVVYGIISVESQGNPFARRGISTGLMQVNGYSSEERKLLLNPLFNIRRGVALLHLYYLELGSESKAIQAYNIGIGNFLKERNLPMAQTYLAKVRENERNCHGQ